MLFRSGVLLVTNVYDHRSRRVRKEVSVWDGQVEAYVPQSSAHYLWDGWNVVRETVAVGSGSTQSVATNYYTWGLDLSGTLQGAGGVGGLLAVLRNGTPYFPCYDANGNVTGYVATNGASVARYEYSPFGETTAKTGSMADTFTHRFSTKPFDAETGLAMYQLRPYEPVLGRWLSKDPIDEQGGLNLYGFAGNDPVNRWDYLGLLEKKILPLRVYYEKLTFEAGNYSARESLICVCAPLDGCGRKKVKCMLLAMPQIRLSSDKSILEGAQRGPDHRYPNLSVEEHERNHHKVWLAQYVPKYEKLVAQYENSSCCNCQKRIVELQKYFQAVKVRLNEIEHMLEYGWADLAGKLVDSGGREPWLDYGNDGQFLVDIPSPKEACK